MTPQDMLNKASELKHQADKLNEEANGILQQWAESTCPHKVGSIAKCSGYSHTGKNCKITKIFCITGWSGEREWAIKALVLKIDGTVGKMECAWTQRQEKKDS